MNKHHLIELFETLLVPSPSGSETELAEVIKSHLEKIGTRYETDPAGNLMVKLPGTDPDAPLIIYAAHMDEIGMVVTQLNDDGVLRVTRSGGLEPWKLGEGPVDVFGDNGVVKGVFSMGSTHTKETSEKAITWNDICVLTGITRDELNSHGVRPGSPVLPTRERRGPELFGPADDPLVGAWTFDDRMGCVVLLELIRSMQEKAFQPSHPTIIAFTTQEEIGGHGSKYLVRTLDPEIFISVDGVPMPPGTDLQLDGRPGIWTKDRNAQYDPGLIRALMKSAMEAGTELQPAVFDSTASDASMASYSLGIPRIACLGHVRENSHGYEVARLSVFKNLINTLLTFIKSFDG